MCLYPKLIDNPKYKKSKKNGGIIPPLLDKRVGKVPIGCSKCMECLKKKAREWQVRLSEEIRVNNTGRFVTLSFSDESLIELEEYLKNEQINELTGYELDNEIATKGVRLFLERWRRKYKKSVRHWLVTELGQKNTERVHLHGLLFTDKTVEEIEDRWKYGNVWIGSFVNERTINYITKYVSKSDNLHKEYKPKILTSAGIGSSWKERRDKNVNKYNGENTKEYYRSRNGYKLALPIYYRNFIYSEEEREKLWIHKLDEQVRWVNGVKVDISQGEEVYYQRLAQARLDNEFFNYQDDKVNWERKKYELERRYIQYNKRKQKEYSKKKRMTAHATKANK